MFLGAAAELLSLGAVIPFIAVLADPEAALRHDAVAPLAAAIDLDRDHLPVAFGALFAMLVVAAMAMRLAMMWANIRFANGLGAEIGETLYARTLQRPYSFHVSCNTSQIIGSMNKVQKLIIGYIQPLLAGVTGFVIAVSIVAEVIKSIRVDGLT